MTLTGQDPPTPVAGAMPATSQVPGTVAIGLLCLAALAVPGVEDPVAVPTH